MARFLGISVLATAVASLALTTALVGCGGGGSQAVADLAPTATTQLISTTVEVVVTASGLAVAVNTTSKSSEHTTTVPTATGTANVAGIAGYKVVDGFVVDVTGKQFFLRPDVDTDVSVSTAVGGQVVTGSAKLTGRCAQYTKNVGGVCLVTDVHAMVFTTVNGQSVLFFKRGMATVIADVALPSTLSCVPSTLAHDNGVWVGCSVAVGAGVGHATFSVTPTGYTKVADTSAAGTPEYRSSMSGWPVGCGGSSLSIDGGCLTQRSMTFLFDFTAADGSKSEGIRSWGGSVVF